jgi:hypothetical protein
VAVQNALKGFRENQEKKKAAAAAKAPTLAEIEQGINNRKNAKILKEQKKMKTSGMTVVEPIQNPTQEKGFTSFGGGRRRTVNKRLNKRSSRRSTYRR